MDINFALKQFQKSPYTKIKIGTKLLDVKITGYSNYKNGVLLIPAHANMLPDSYLYFVDSNGSVKEVLPIQVAMDTNTESIKKINL